ncbi:MAG: sulfotransferase [Anaerolineae bacterium]|nr:sulfotransferase [Anaerolineae bacterium]
MTDFPQDGCRNAVLVVGVGRSGTTWLAEIINHDNHYRYLFEPLHPDEGIPLAARLKNATYLRPDYRDAALESVVYAMLTGQNSNAYVEQYNKNPDSPFCLVKSIRLGLAMNWLHARFPEMPIVYIVRFPGAVIGSQMRFKWGSGEFTLRYLLEQPELVEDYLYPFVDVMVRAKDEFERRLYLWCAQLYVLTRQFPQDGPLHWLYYERLYADPLAEARRLFAYLGKPFDEEAVARVVGRPSQTAWKSGKGNVMNRWRDDLTPAQLNRIVEALSLFGLDTLYDQPSMPAEVCDWLRPIPAHAALGMTVQRLARRLKR